MLTNEQLDNRLAQSPAPRVTKEHMMECIKNTKFQRLTDTLTHCTLTLDNGYVVTGESACVNVANYNKEIGEKIAFDAAFNKLWPLFGFLLAQRQYMAKSLVNRQEA